MERPLVSLPISKSSVIRVIVAPTHDERVNMAIDKGLLYLYRTVRGIGTSDLDVASQLYWDSSSGDYAIGYAGAGALAFAENGHKALNDQEDDATGIP